MGFGKFCFDTLQLAAGSFITISRCSYTYGKDVAGAVAKTLGYACISREELMDASQEFNMPGIKLVRELPIILEQTIFNKYRYISYNGIQGSGNVCEGARLRTDQVLGNMPLMVQNNRDDAIDLASNATNLGLIFWWKMMTNASINTQLKLWRA